ncbi:hypothetical protein POTOM_002121 [Populus tomentosa]|uniref:RRM domain-containing protein n=1 Tax=Populus tomentosa TaxID=118781 RepID=A0A8X8DJ31_POPTO|nr:hypothetical protein POTOM_002121 [Populus tomentosa]
MAQTISLRKGNTRLPPEVNRVLYVRNLPFNISSEEMYDIFGKYGAIRQIRIGTNKDTRGTAFVVYEDIYDAKTAVDHLSGFNVANRILKNNGESSLTLRVGNAVDAYLNSWLIRLTVLHFSDLQEKYTILDKREIV